MAKLNFGRLDYLPDRKNIGIGDVKVEYQRLKTIAQKRLKTMGKSEFSNSKTYQYYNRLFGKGRGSVKGKTEAQLRVMLYQVQQFVSSQRTTVSGMRSHMRSTIKQVNEQYGEEILNKDNFNQYIEFINDKSMEAIYEQIGSDQQLTLWAFRSKGVPMKVIREQWSELLDNEESVKQYINERRQKGKKINNRQLKKLL